MVFFGCGVSDAVGDGFAFEPEVFLPVVDVACVVVALVDVVAVASSFFWDWQPRNTAIVSTVIKDKTDVFIGLVKLNKFRECRSAPRRASTKLPK